MGKIKLQKNGYNKFVLEGPLAIEDYYDTNNVSEEEKNAIRNMYKKLDDYNEAARERIKRRDALVDDLIYVIEMIGTEKFTIHDDGDISYNYDKNQKGG